MFKRIFCFLKGESDQDVPNIFEEYEFEDEEYENEEYESEDWTYYH